jgi:hypothetical protein
VRALPSCPSSFVIVRQDVIKQKVEKILGKISLGKKFLGNMLLGKVLLGEPKRSQCGIQSLRDWILDWEVARTFAE